MKKLLIILFNTLVISVYAQGIPRNQEISPKSPEMANMPRFDNLDVNEYSGRANISFPLVNLDFDNKNLNLSLNYNSGGILTSQEASWVGLGWNIVGLPSITRRINGSSDIGSQKKQQTSYGYSENNLNIPTGYFSNQFKDDLESSPLLSSSIFVDTQPDIFTANLLNGETVVFELSRGNPTDILDGIILNDSRAKIEFDSELDNFSIIDGNGYVYYFSDKEYSSNFTQDSSAKNSPFASAGENIDNYATFDSGTAQNYYIGSHINIISSWHITKIISPNGLELKFNYSGGKFDPNNPNQLYIPHLTLSPSYSNSLKKIAECSSQNGVQYDINPVTVNTYSRSIIENKYLEEIINLSTGERIVFKLRDREDIVSYDNTTHFFGSNMELPGGSSTDYGNAKQLAQIEKYTNSGNIKNKIVFNTSYFNSDELDELHKDNFLRLKLDNLLINNDIYTFQYEQPNSLPMKSTSAVDFWGFYNGIISNEKTPRLKWENDFGISECFAGIPVNTLFDGYKAGSSFSHSKIGTLNKITYPTGGYSTIQYEPNEIQLSANSSSSQYRNYTKMFLETNNNQSGYPIYNATADTYKFAVGGIRVASIDNFTDENLNVSSTSYFYEGGKLMNDLLYYYHLDELSLDGNVFQTYLIISNSNKHYPVNSANGNHVGYDIVKKQKLNVDNGSVNGWIISGYNNQPNKLLNSTSSSSNAIDAPPVNFNNTNGDIEYQYLINTVGDTLSKTTYIYDNIVSNTSYGWKIYYDVQKGFFTFGGASTPYSSSQVYDYIGYSTQQTFSKLIEKFSQTYHPGNKISSVKEEFQYNANRTLKEKAITYPEDSNFEEREEYYYPNSLDFNIDNQLYMSNLVADNRIAIPVYKRRFRNGRFINHEFTTYSSFNSKILPSKIKSSKIDSPLSEIETRIEYKDYNILGKPITISTDNSRVQRYLYGFEDNKLIASISNYKMLNETPEEIVDYTIINNPRSNGQAIQAEIEKVRTHPDYLSSSVVSYSYNELAQVDEITDEREYKTKYSYINNRLSEIRNNDSFLVNEYEYKLVHSNSDCISSSDKITISSNLGYGLFVNQSVDFSISMPIGYSTMNAWKIYMGDVLTGSGTGQIPSTITHSFAQTGLKPIRVFTFHSDGATYSGNLNVRVLEGAIPGSDVYFGDIINTSSTQKSAKIYGDPGSQISYYISQQGSSGGHTGYVAVGNNYYDTSSYTSFSGQTTIPSSGYISCTIKNYGGSSGSTSVLLKLTQTTIGQIGSPSSLSITNGSF